MTQPRFRPFTPWLVAVAIPLLAALAGCQADNRQTNGTGNGPAGLHAIAGPDDPHAATFGDPFWEAWGDGKAELAGYDLTFTRYGQPRSGTAVTIYIPEEFSNEARVKAGPERPKSDRIPVMKLNLMRDFATGVYDYNLMTSVFTTMAPALDRPAGTPLKVTFSSQEWCGHVWTQHDFYPRELRTVGFSYFDGEGATQDTGAYPGDGFSEDAVLNWARGYVWPKLDAGQSRDVMVHTATHITRLRHVEPAWLGATAQRSAEPQAITVPAGEFRAWVMTLTIPAADAADGATDRGGRKWTVHVEDQSPWRIVRWQLEANGDTSEVAELVKSERQAYWQLHDNGDESRLAGLGLQPRKPRTP